MCPMFHEWAIIFPSQTDNCRQRFAIVIAFFVHLEVQFIVTASFGEYRVQVRGVIFQLKLIPANETRLQHLTSQLKWRLREGLGEAIYEIGVADDGKLVGLNDEDMEMSLGTMEEMAKSLGAEILLVREFIYEGRRLAEVMLRQTPDSPGEFVDFRIAMLGMMDSGKSTIVGVLSSGELDNGRGKARLNLFRHPHEIQSGRTSSISREMIGFTTGGQVINYSMSDTPEQIFQQSFKLITFTDLAGHQKYLRTTISGLMASKPDFIMLVVSGVSGNNQSSAEYLALAAALRLPVFVVITKADCCDPSRLTQVVNETRALVDMSSTQLSSFRISNEDDCVSAAFRMACETVVPIFTISNVTGLNLNLLIKFLSMLPCTIAAKVRDLSMREPAEFQIDKSYIIDGVGTVVTGILMRGMISAGDLLVLGPSCNGDYTKVRVTSIQRSHAPCRLVRTGQSAAVGLQIENMTFPIRRGMVLADPMSTLVPCRIFEALLRILVHAKRVTKGLQGTVHCGYICQTAVITDVEIQKDMLNGVFENVVRLRFMKQPECLRPGDQFIFRDGKLKAIGTVYDAVPLSS